MFTPLLPSQVLSSQRSLCGVTEYVRLPQGALAERQHTGMDLPKLASDDRPVSGRGRRRGGEWGRGDPGSGQA